MGSSSSKAARNAKKSSAASQQKSHAHPFHSLSPKHAKIPFTVSHPILHSEADFKALYDKEKLSVSQYLGKLVAYFRVVTVSNSKLSAMQRADSIDTNLDLNASTMQIDWARREISPTQLLQLAIHSVPLGDIAFIEMVQAQRFMPNERYNEALDVPLLRVVANSGEVWLSDLVSRRDWNYIMVHEKLMQCEYYFDLWKGGRGGMQAADATPLPANPTLWHYLSHRYASFSEWRDELPYHWHPVYFTKLQPPQISLSASKRISATLRDSFVKVRIGYKNPEDAPGATDAKEVTAGDASVSPPEHWILNAVLLDASDREELERCVCTNWNESEWEFNVTFPQSGQYLLRVDACILPTTADASAPTPQDCEWFSLGTCRLDTEKGIDSLPTKEYCKLYPEIDSNHWIPTSDAIIEPDIGAFKFGAPVSFVFRSDDAMAVHLVNQSKVVEMKQNGNEFFANEVIEPGRTQVFVTRQEDEDPVLLYTYQSNIHPTYVQYEPQALRYDVRLLECVGDSYERQLKLSLPPQFTNLKCHLRNLTRSELRHDAVLCTRTEDDLDILTKLPSQGKFALEVFGDFVEFRAKKENFPVYEPKEPKKEIFSETFQDGNIEAGAAAADTNHSGDEVLSPALETLIPRNLLFTYYYNCEDDNHELPSVRQIFPVQHPAFFEYYFELTEPLHGELEATEYTFELRTPHEDIVEVCLCVPNSSLKPQVISSDNGRFSSGWSGSLLQHKEEKKMRQSAPSPMQNIDRQKTLELRAKTRDGRDLVLLTYTVLIDEVLAQIQGAPDHNDLLATISER